MVVFETNFCFATDAFISPPETIVLKANSCVTTDVFIIFFQREFSKLRRPIAVEFCHVIDICLAFVTYIQKILGAATKKF